MWQPSINWAAVKASGVTFAFIKAAEGTSYVDPLFATHYPNAKAAGLVVGAYDYAWPNMATGGAAAADWFLAHAPVVSGDLPPVLDVETTNGLTVAQLQAWVESYAYRVWQRTGVRIMIYVSPAFWTKYLGNTTWFPSNGYPLLWIAHWTTAASPTLPAANWGGNGWTFWQYTSSGTTPGISGAVDLDRYNGTDLTRVRIPSPMPLSAPTSVVAAPGSVSALVGWTAPANRGATPITSYTVTASPGGATCTSSGVLSCTVIGLVNGTPYTFTVTAANASGTGPGSDPSTPVVPFGGATYVPLAPVRVLDTRNATGLPGVFASGVARTFPVAGHGGVPANAVAVTGNLTVTAQTRGGYVALGPVATATPSTSTLNFPAGDSRANGVTVQLGAGGTLSATYITGRAGDHTALILDITGYYVNDASGATYVPLAPVRVLDTRNATGLPGVFASGVARTFPVAGHGGVPANAVAVTGNLTVTAQTRGGYVALGPVATATPSTSTLNFPAGDSRANGVTVQLGAGGTLSATYITGRAGDHTALILDITGYYVNDASGATYVPLAPVRVLDTRNATGLPGVFASGVARTFPVAGHGGVPANAVAVTGNLTVTAQTRGGYVALGPVATATPSTSTLNFPAGDSRANGVTVQLGAGGTLSATYITGRAGDHTALILDITGYYIP